MTVPISPIRFRNRAKEERKARGNPGPEPAMPLREQLVLIIASTFIILAAAVLVWAWLT